MHRLPENMFLLTLRQDHFNNERNLLPTRPFIDFENSYIFTQFNKNDPIRHFWRLLSETRMHLLPENMFLLSPQQDHFSNKKKFNFYSPINRLQNQ